MFILFSLALIVDSPLKALHANVNNQIELDSHEIIKLAKHIANYGSRVTGYPGFHKVASYIVNYFKELGISVKIHEYDVVVPIDEGSSIRILSTNEVFEAFALWPNSIEACPTPYEGLSGTLIYVGDGNLDKLKGKRIKDAIVLMDFNSGYNWLRVASLGAKAIIFIEPLTTTRYEALSKFLDTPIYIPRLYVKSAIGAYLKQLCSSNKEIRVSILSRIVYERVKALNIIGIINGTKNPNDIIIISAHYDSWSVVPSISYGVDEAISISTLLHLAKYFSRHKPLRTLWFVAFSGHYQGLAGAREFVEEFFFSREVLSREIRINLHINLDLSSDSSSLSLLYAGSFYSYSSSYIASNYAWIVKMIYGKYLVPIAERLGTTTTNLLINAIREDYWWDGSPIPYIIDSEPAAITGVLAITLRTTHSYRMYWWTPINDTRFISLDNVEKQLMIVSAIINGFAMEENWGTSPVTPIRFQVTPVALGFVTVYGKVVVYNLTTGWYTPVSNALIRVSFQRPMYPFAYIYEFSDENGNFIIHGLRPVLSGSSWYVEAWVVNKSNGEILYAPDQGPNGWGSMPPQFYTFSHPANITTVVARFISVTLYDIFDIYTLRRTIIRDPRFVASSFQSEIRNIMPYDFNTRSQMFFYGSYINGYEPVAMVFVPPESRISIVFYAGGTVGKIAGILVNASDEYPEGYGFVVKHPINIYFTAYRFASDLYYVSNHRYEALKSHFVRDIIIEESLKKCKKLLPSIEHHVQNLEYDQAYYLALRAWAWALRSYQEVMSSINDVSMTAVLFFTLSLLFGFLFERLIFTTRNLLRRITMASVIIVILLIIFYFIHPSLTLMSNSAIGMMAIILSLLFIATVYLFLEETSVIVKEEALKRLGMHRAETGRFGAFIVSFSMALENMKRRYLRTLLVLLTIVAVTISLTSLTSMPEYMALYAKFQPNVAPRGYLLIMGGEPVPPPKGQGILDYHAIDYLMGIFLEGNASVAPRVWYYPTAEFPSGTVVRIYSPKSGNSTEIRALLGLTPIDSRSIFRNALIKGRAFTESDVFACIIPDYIAKALKVDVGDSLVISGINLRVVGIYSLEIIRNLIDLDGRRMTPIDPLTVQEINIIQVPRAAELTPLPLPWLTTLIVPEKLARNLGGYVAQVVVYNYGDKFEEALEEIVKTTFLRVYAPVEGNVYMFSSIKTRAFLGWQSVVVILIIGGLNIVATILGAVKERMREIDIYAVLGLSPRGAAMLFLTEAITYAVIGTVIGYLCGFGISLIFYSLGILPREFVLNYSSFAVGTTVLIVIFATLLSALYPSIAAAKSVTPSLRRKWTFATRPRGDIWEIPIPLVIPSTSEMLGLLCFLHEYYCGEGKVKMTYRVDDISPLSPTDLSFSLRVALAPFEMGIVQEVKIAGVKTNNTYSLMAFLRRISGSRSSWIIGNFYFIDSLRRQALLWRALPIEKRREYIQAAQV